MERFYHLLENRTVRTLLNVYGPGGIGKTVVLEKLVGHARAREIPAAAVDGAHPGLTPDQILYQFTQQLAVGPSGASIADAFREFETAIHDYLVVKEILQRHGGIHALFNTLGAVKDPAGLAALIGGMGRSLSEAASKTVRNRFALDRYLRGADESLTNAFTAGLTAALERIDRPIALLLDTYEELEALDDWVCRTLVPALPQRARMVILGRNRLDRVNFDWRDHGDALDIHPLPELEERDAKIYLRHYGLTDSDALDSIYRFTGGYPLLLVLVRQLAQELGGWDRIGALEGRADRDAIATGLLERILREERVEEVRELLEKGAVAPWFDPETVAVILEVGLDEARAVYDRIQRHSFVERHPYGLRLHDKIRELLQARLEFTSASELERLRARLADHYATKAGIPGAATDS